jgi:hypothetical protein
VRTDLAGLRKGDVVVASVSEQLSSYEYIVSISGQLIQVQNHTLQQFAVGSSVELLVTGVKPLQLQLSLGKTRKSRRGLDVSV